MKNAIRMLILISVLTANLVPANAQVSTEKVKVKEKPFGTEIKRTEKTRLGDETIKRTARSFVPDNGGMVRKEVRFRRGLDNGVMIRRDVRVRRDLDNGLIMRRSEERIRGF